MKPECTWILIANGTEARIYQSTGKSTQITGVDGMAFESAALHAREIMTDKQGRTFDSSGSGRHAMEYPSDPTEQRLDQFAAHLAGVLNDGLRKKAFDRLAVAAGPKMLANLRRHLSADTQARVKIAIDKDYVKTPIADLPLLLHEAGVTG